jgi:Zn-dependent membrane protease YugP
MYGFYVDPQYLMLVIISAVLGFATQAYINSTYKKWSDVPAMSGTSGAQVARHMLDVNGASAVGITRVEGHLTDYFDPRDNRLHLSGENFEGGSVSSVAVACHEAGHAVQTAQGYLPGRIRTAIVPAVNFTQQTWSIVFMIGVLFNMAGFVTLSIVLFAFSVVFQLITLPVEIDASRRAVAYLGQTGAIRDQAGAKKVLTAAALTYVASALMSILQLLYLVGRSRRD